MLPSPKRQSRRQSSTNRASTGPLKYERLVLDSDVNAYVKGYLEAVGFNVVLAAQMDVNIRNDVDVLKWARAHKRLLICHDKHRDGQTRIPLYQEICARGGKIIRIGGKPDQHPLTSTGKILVHRHEWLAFFQERSNGVAVVHQTGCKLMPTEELREQYQRRMNIELDPIPGLEANARRRSGNRERRPRPVPAEQYPFI